MNDSFIKKLICLVEANLANEKFGSEELAKEAGLSSSSLYRKLKSINNQTTSQFIREIRLKKARELLHNEDLTAAEISYKVGFGSPSYFNKCFHEYFGLAPGEFRNQEQESELEEKPVESLTGKRENAKIRIVLIIALIILIPTSYFLIHRIIKSKSLIANEKSIAVLPFVDYSPEKGNAYIINGLMDEILDKLQNIGELKVKSGTDVEKYRDTKKSTAQIGRELNVNYILEGSGQKIEDELKLRLQLIETSSGNHIWSRTFIETTEDIFKLQEDVAFSVASELNASLTLEEKREIKKLPTQNTAAYNLYLLGLDHFRIAERSSKLSDWSNYISQNREAQKCFEQAVFIDSTFADAYFQLSHYYTDLIYYHMSAQLNPSLQLSYLDTGYYYTTKTIEYDNKNQNALQNLMKYYLRKGMKKEAKEAEKQLMKIAEKDYLLYEFLMDVHREHEENYDFVRCYYEYQNLKPEDLETPLIFLRTLFNFLRDTGFPEKAREVAEELLVRTNDSIGYWHRLNLIAYYSENDHSLKYLHKAYQKDSTQSLPIDRLKTLSMMNRNYDDALYYLNKEKKIEKEKGNIETFNRVNGFIYLKNGFEKEAEIELNEGEKRNLEQIQLNTPYAQKYHAHAQLAKIYAIRGEKEKALVYMKQIKNRQTYAHQWIVVLKTSPMLDNIQNEPEFKEVIADLEGKYQKEHERIALLLKELGEID